MVNNSRMHQKNNMLPRSRGNRSLLCLLAVFLITSLVISSCAPREATINMATMITPLIPTAFHAPTSGRPEYAPGKLVDYTAQNGDTLFALAARFNTTTEEIMEANPIIPLDATTMPPGMPMKIPIYY